ncbi:GNAT family N-acetyltransferase [Endozoicomonas sp. Mp262]|uniref:GNAT family N-acetyltransferase n=1 Tax=Endozoicomonas sp. Mp262 TaxID=2919499 RepID=UPI0021DA1A2F
MYLREVKKGNLFGDMAASLMLATFYGVEMQSALGWSVERRYRELTKTQMMIDEGLSRMILAENPQGMPLGMIVCTNTDSTEIQRIEAIIVAEAFRAKGIGRKLLQAAKGNKEFHAFATPKSLSWYKRNGFKVIGKHEEGTTEVTTAENVGDYKFKIRAPMPTEIDDFMVDMLKKVDQYNET